MMFVEKVDSDTLERETMNHNITGLVPSPNWLTGLDSMDVCKDEKNNWPTEPRGVVTVMTNTDNVCKMDISGDPSNHTNDRQSALGYDRNRIFRPETGNKVKSGSGSTGTGMNF